MVEGHSFESVLFRQPGIEDWDSEADATSEPGPRDCLASGCLCAKAPALPTDDAREEIDVDVDRGDSSVCGQQFS